MAVWLPIKDEGDTAGFTVSPEYITLAEMKITTVLFLVTLGLVCSAYAAPLAVHEQPDSLIRSASSSIQDYNDDNADAQFFLAQCPIAGSLAMPLVTNLASNLLDKVAKEISIQDDDDADHATLFEALLKSLKDEAEVEGNIRTNMGTRITRKILKEMAGDYLGKKEKQLRNKIIFGNQNNQGGSNIWNLEERRMSDKVKNYFQNRYNNVRDGIHIKRELFSDDELQDGNRRSNRNNDCNRKVKAQMFGFIKHWLQRIRNKLHPTTLLQ